METIIKMIVFGLVLILSSHAVVGYTDDVSDDVGVRELRSMLTATMEQNRRLEQQNRRMKLIWKGLQHMCSALQSKPSEEDAFPDEDTSDFKGENDGENNSSEAFRITHITSSGVRKDSCVQLSAQYQAPDQHSREWLQYTDNFFGARFSGTKKMTKVGKVRKYFTTSLTVCNATLNEMADLSVIIYSANESIWLTFNTTAILINGSQELPETSTTMVSHETSYQAKANEDLNVTIVVNGSLHNPRVSSAMQQTSLLFSGLNTTSKPPSIFEKVDIASAATHRDNSTFNYAIELKSDYIQYGGILTIYLRHPYPLNGFAHHMYFSKNIDILSPSARTVVPFQSFGMYELPKQTLIFKPSVTISCAAMGWPRPDITILKQTILKHSIAKNGNEQAMQMEEKLVQQYTIAGSLTVFSNQTAAGTYVCRASQGNRTLETTTEAIVHVPVVFDDARTAVLTNTTRKTVISCKASGVPIPELTLKTPLGNDLTASGIYKVSRRRSGKHTAQVIVTVSPVDTLLTYVICSANQSSIVFPSQRRIPVFPDGSNSTYYEFTDFTTL